MAQQKPYSLCLYLESREDGGYTVTSPDLPGLVAEGKTPEEILQNVQEAVDALKAAWEQLGVEIPPALQGRLGDHPGRVQMLVLA